METVKLQNYNKTILNLCLYIISLSPIIIFFYDVFNFQTSTYASNFLLMGLNPENIGGAETGAGFFIYLYDLFQVFSIDIVHYNYLYGAIILKIFSIVFLFFTGRISSRIICDVNPRYSKLAFYAIAYNPFILFIIMVGPYTSVIIFFMLLLGIYEIKGGIKDKTLGWIFILLASAWYVFPTFIIPSILVYSGKNKKKEEFINSILTFIFVFLIFIPSIFIFYIISANLVSNFSQTQTLAPYSFFLILNMTPGQISTYSRFLPYFLLILSITLPLSLKKYRVNEYLNYAILLLTILTIEVGYLSPDYFTSALPFLIVGVLSMSTKMSFVRIFILESFLIPQFFLLNLRNGLDNYTGFYYWGYYIFHTSTPSSYFSDLGGNLSWRISLLLFIVLLSLTIYGVLEYSRHDSKFKVSVEYKKLIDLKLLSKKQIVTTVCTITILIIIISVPIFHEYQLGYNGNSSINSTTFSEGKYPTYQWVPPNEGYTISGNLECFSASTHQNNIGIFRNITEQKLKLTANIVTTGFNKSYNFNKISYISTNIFSIGYSHSLNVSMSNKVEPNKVVNSSFTTINSSLYFNGFNNGSRLYGDGYLQYNLTYSNMIGKSFVFGTYIITNNSRLNAFFSLYNNGNNAFVSLHRFNDGTYQLVFQHYNNKYYYNFTTTSFKNNEWIPVTMRMINDKNLNVQIGDYQYIFYNIITPGENSTLYLGMANSNVKTNNDTFSLNGKLTNLYCFSGLPKLSITTFLKTENSTKVLNGNLNSLRLNISNNLTTLGGSVSNLNVQGINNFLWIGKLAKSNTSVKINIKSLDISADSKNVVNVPYTSLVLPFLLILIVTNFTLTKELWRRMR